MEIEAIGQSHKPALLQDGYVAQLRKQNLVNRLIFIENEKIISQKLLRGEQASRARESISTALFGTSMSAQLILGLEQVPRVRLFAG